MDSLYELKKLAGLTLQEEAVDSFHFGCESETNAGKVAIALAKAGLTVDLEEAMGIFYFNFKDKKSFDKAHRVAAKVVDKSEESEW